MVQGTAPAVPPGEHGWSKAIFYSIDWILHGRYFDPLATTTQFLVSKDFHKWRLTLSKLCRFHPMEYPDTMCTIYQEGDEDIDHIFQWNHIASTKLQNVHAQMSGKMAMPTSLTSSA